MPTRLEIRGLDELRQALRDLPADLTNEASVIVQAHADDAAGQIRDVYQEHRVTGHLAGGVTVDRSHSAFTTRAIVRSKAKHAHLFEFGSQLRHHDSGKSVGAMPARPTVIPIAQRTRRRMVAVLVNLVRKAGFQVG